MGLWNRLAVSLVSLFLIIAAVVTLLVATEAVPPEFLPGGVVGDGLVSEESWFQSELEDLASYEGLARVISMAISIAVAAIMLLVLLAQWRLGQKTMNLLVSVTGEGGLSIEEDSVRYLAERTGQSNRNVTRLRCGVRIQGRRNVAPARVIITCYPRLILGSNVQDIRDDLQQRVKVSVESLTGLLVDRVDVASVRYERSDASKLMGG